MAGPNSVLVCSDGSLLVTQNGGIDREWRAKRPAAAVDPARIDRRRGGGAGDGDRGHPAERAQRPRVRAGRQALLHRSGRRLQPTTPPPPGYIFSLDPDGTEQVVVEAGQTFPNGITVEADGNVVWVESFTRAVRRYHVDTGKVEDVCILEDPDAIPDGLKPATNGDLYIATVLTGGVNVVGADGTDKGLLKGFGDYVSNVQFRGSTLYVTDIGGGSGDDASYHGSISRTELDGVTGLDLFPGTSARKEATRQATSAFQDSGGARTTTSGTKCVIATEGTVNDFHATAELRRRARVSGAMTRDEFIQRGDDTRHRRQRHRRHARWLPARRPRGSARGTGAGRRHGQPAGPAEGAAARRPGQDRRHEEDTSAIDVKMTALPVGPLNEKLSPERQGDDRHLRPISVLGFTVAAVRRRRQLHAAQLAASRSCRRDTASRSDFAPSANSSTRATSTPKKQAFGGQDAVPDPGPLRRPDHPVLPQGPAREGRGLPSRPRGRSISRPPRSSTCDGDRRQHDGGEVGRRVDVPGRLVHAGSRAWAASS